MKFRFNKNSTELPSADVMLHITPLKKQYIHTLSKIIVGVHYTQQCKLFSLFSKVAISYNILPERQVAYTTCTCHSFNSIIYTYIYTNIYICVCVCVLSTASRENNCNIYKYLSHYFSQLETVYICPGKVGNLCLVKDNIY